MHGSILIFYILTHDSGKLLQYYDLNYSTVVFELWCDTVYVKRNNKLKKQKTNVYLLCWYDVQWCIYWMCSAAVGML